MVQKKTSGGKDKNPATGLNEENRTREKATDSSLVSTITQIFRNSQEGKIIFGSSGIVGSSNGKPIMPRTCLT
jgi:hypothetical protein